MIIKTQGGLTYINSKHIVEFRVNRLHDEEKKCAIIAKLDYEEKENTLAAYADEEQFKEEFSRFITAMITDEDKVFFFAAEKEVEPKKEPETETEPEQEQPAEEKIDIDKILDSMKKVYVQMLLNRAEDIRYIDEWMAKEENGSGKEI